MQNSDNVAKPVYFVQHADVPVGPHLFAEHVGREYLQVRSEFSTIQGEGPFAGRYALFIRLAGCNFGDKQKYCQFCDTDFRISKSQPMSFAQLKTAIEFARTDLVVITGGEPTLQSNVIRFCATQPDIHFQFESNGTQHLVIDALLEQPNVTVVVSPKFSLSGATMQPSKTMLEKAHFKFLISADSTQHEYGIPSFAFDAQQPVYLSPIAVYRKSYEGEVVNAWDPELVDHEATAKNYARAAYLAQSLSRSTGKRFLLSIQQHIFTSVP